MCHVCSAAMKVIHFQLEKKKEEGKNTHSILWSFVQTHACTHTHTAIWLETLVCNSSTLSVTPQTLCNKSNSDFQLIILCLSISVNQKECTHVCIHKIFWGLPTRTSYLPWFWFYLKDGAVFHPVTFCWSVQVSLWHIFFPLKSLEWRVEG